MSLWLPLAVTGHGLREYAALDIPRLCDLADDAAVWRQMTDLFPHPYDERAGLRWVMQQVESDPPCNLAIVGPDGLVGGVGVLLSSVPNFAHDGELGYWLGRRYWGRGLATAAVEAFCAWVAPAHGLTRFTAKVFDGNAPSQRLLERCGFTHEGTLRGAARKEGRTLDMHVYGRIVAP